MFHCVSSYFLHNSSPPFLAFLLIAYPLSRWYRTATALGKCNSPQLVLIPLANVHWRQNVTRSYYYSVSRGYCEIYSYRSISSDGLLSVGRSVKLLLFRASLESHVWSPTSRLSPNLSPATPYPQYKNILLFTGCDFVTCSCATGSGILTIRRPQCPMVWRTNNIVQYRIKNLFGR